MSEKTNLEIEVFAALRKRDQNYKWLANQMGISQAYLSDILKGQRNPTGRIDQIKDLLGLRG